MFKSKKDNQFVKGGHTLFDHALEVNGDVKFGGTLDVEGTVNGDIAAVDGVDALVHIREKGCVNGNIHAPKIIVNGEVNGDIFASKHLELAAKAIVNGSVHYQVIEMVKGSQVNGSLVHIEVQAPSSEAVADKPGAKVQPMKSAADA